MSRFISVFCELRIKFHLETDVVTPSGGLHKVLLHNDFKKWSDVFIYTMVMAG